MIQLYRRMQQPGPVSSCCKRCHTGAKENGITAAKLGGEFAMKPMEVCGKKVRFRWRSTGIRLTKIMSKLTEPSLVLHRGSE
jgi:hypothetical protein